MLLKLQELEALEDTVQKTVWKLRESILKMDSTHQVKWMAYLFREFDLDSTANLGRVLVQVGQELADDAEGWRCETCQDCGHQVTVGAGHECPNDNRG